MPDGYYGFIGSDKEENRKDCWCKVDMKGLYELIDKVLGKILDSQCSLTQAHEGKTKLLVVGLYALEKAIIAGEIPGDFVYRDEHVLAFRDINPIAPTHILIIPNKHIASVDDLDAKDEPLIGHLFTVAKQLAAVMGIDQSGHRLIINSGPDAGQVVYHLHLHLLGGKPMGRMVNN